MNVQDADRGAGLVDEEQHGDLVVLHEFHGGAGKDVTLDTRGLRDITSWTGCANRSPAM